MSAGLCPMCRRSDLAIIDERLITGSIYTRRSLVCSDLECGYSWWGRKPAPGDITDAMADEVAH